MKISSNFFMGFMVATSMGASAAWACSRAVWLGPENAVITGRSMDWAYGVNTKLYIFPRGVENVGIDGPKALTWKSKYGSVVAAGSSTPGGSPIDTSLDGMNEKGLGANLLYLGATEWPPLGNAKPRISWTAWVQYILSNYPNVAEAVKGAEKAPVDIVPSTFLDGKGHPNVHMALTDASGDSAILEHISGKLIIHHDRKFQVMTNDPSYDKQLTLMNYWQKIDGNVTLPGSHQSEDRFVRASFYMKKLPQTTNERQQVAGVFSIMRNVSVPWGQTDAAHPNLSPTLWRTALDHKRLVYYFESSLSPNVVWVNLNKIDFSVGSGVRVAAVEGSDVDLVGDIGAAFKPSEYIRYLKP
jgi:penicillin V acylase-like amidase (Ntn superfamily)